MPFIHGTAAGKVDHSHFLNFRAEHYWVLPRFQWNQILYSTAGVGGARVLASLGPAKGADFHPDAVFGGMKRF